MFTFTAVSLNIFLIFFPFILSGILCFLSEIKEFHKLLNLSFRFYVVFVIGIIVLYNINGFYVAADFTWCFFQFHLDNLGIVFLTLNVLLFSLCIYILEDLKYTDVQFRFYVHLLLIIIGLLNIVFCCADILTFFIAFEIVLIPIVLMISNWGSVNRIQANNYLIFYTAVGAVPIIIAIVYIWNSSLVNSGLFSEAISIFWSVTSNTSSISGLSFSHLSTVNWEWQEEIWLWLAFFFAFAIKTPIVPFHIWLPKAHVDAPTVGSVVLAGLLLKVGLFGFLRLLFPVFPHAIEFFAPYVAAFATVGVVYASFVTLRQIDLKRIIAYSSVAHINIALVSLCSLNKAGILSSIFLILSHGIVSSALFFLIGFLYHRFHQRLTPYYGGLATLMPYFTIFLFYFSLANIAFPLTVGFIGEFWCLTGIISTSFILGFVNSISILLTTVYSIIIFGRISFGLLSPKLVQVCASIISDTGRNKLSDLKKFVGFNFDLKTFEFKILLVLVSLSFYFGVFPDTLLRTIVPFVEEIALI